jgi:hypothetical protein
MLGNRNIELNDMIEQNGNRQVIPKLTESELNMGKKTRGGVLDQEDIPLENRFGHIQTLLMLNDPKVFVEIEKFLKNTIRRITLNTFKKFRLLDSFMSMPNGMMRYKTVEWIHCAGLELFWVMFQENITVEYKVQVATFLLRNDIPLYRKKMLVEKLSEYAVANQRTLPIAKLANIVDMLVNSEFEEARATGLRLLEVLRNREDTELKMDNRAAPLFNARTVYTDGQNVHDSQINETVKKALDILASDVQRDEDVHDILKRDPVDIIDHIEGILNVKGYVDEKIKISLDRITTDTAIFSNKNKMRLRDILQRVWNRIMNYMDQETQKEAIKRLFEELIDMSHMCSTGHMSRIVNVLSGFPVEQGGINSIKITWNAQIKSNIQARLMVLIKKDETGDLLNSMIDSDRHLYLNFIRDNKASIYAELLKEFESVFDKDIEGMDRLCKEKFTTIFETMYAQI